VAESSRPDPDALGLEFLLNALRLREGFSIDLFESRTGLRWHDRQERVARAIELGLLECTGRQVSASPRGWALLDTLLLQLAGD